MNYCVSIIMHTYETLSWCCDLDEMLGEHAKACNSSLARYKNLRQAIHLLLTIISCANNMNRQIMTMLFYVLSFESHNCTVPTKTSVQHNLKFSSHEFEEANKKNFANSRNVCRNSYRKFINEKILFTFHHQHRQRRMCTLAGWLVGWLRSIRGSESQNASKLKTLKPDAVSSAFSLRSHKN